MTRRKLVFASAQTELHRRRRLSLSKSVELSMRPDRELRHGIQDELENESGVNLEQLDVEVCNGAVKLTGTVRSDLEKWKADDAVRRTPGVTVLVNDLQVVRPLAEPRDADAARPWFPEDK